MAVAGHFSPSKSPLCGGINLFIQIPDDANVKDHVLLGNALLLLLFRAFLWTFLIKAFVSLFYRKSEKTCLYCKIKIRYSYRMYSTSAFRRRTLQTQSYFIWPQRKTNCFGLWHWNFSIYHRPGEKPLILGSLPIILSYFRLYTTGIRTWQLDSWFDYD